MTLCLGDIMQLQTLEFHRMHMQKCPSYKKKLFPVFFPSPISDPMLILFRWISQLLFIFERLMTSIWATSYTAGKENGLKTHAGVLLLKQSRFGSVNWLEEPDATRCRLLLGSQWKRGICEVKAHFLRQQHFSIFTLLPIQKDLFKVTQTFLSIYNFCSSPALSRSPDV